MNFIFLAILLLFFQPVQEEFLTSKSGTISFLSEAPLEKIEARNKNFLVKYDPASGKIEATVLMKGFEFRKALMQEHFNESYLESDKYPKAYFKGYVDEKNILLTEDRIYKVSATGMLTMHGVTRTVTIPGTISVHQGGISLVAAFDILLYDYKIKIPAVVRNNIGKTVKIFVTADQFK